MIDYVFGKIYEKGYEVENLKTISDNHTNLNGLCYIQREYPDNVIVDTFKVIRKYQSDELPDGRKYDWYTIEEHSRYIDRFSPKEPIIDEQLADLQELMVDMEYDSIIDGLEE